MSDWITLPMADIRQLARQLLRNSSYAEAECLLRMILTERSSDLECLNSLGMLCHQQNRVQEAEEFINRIIFQDPDNADAYNNLGNIKEVLGQHDEAIKCYQKAITRNPHHASAHNNLGVIFSAVGKTEEAIKVLRQAIVLAPDSTQFRYNLGNALRRGLLIDEAVQAFKEVIAMDSTHSSAWNELAKTFLMIQQRDEAAQVYEEWLKLNPKNQSILYMLEACRGGNTPPKAPESYIRQVFDNMSDRFDAHLNSLGYQGPQLVYDSLAALLPTPNRNLDILDAGCGTGLCGPLFRPYAGSLTGVDLSSGMLEKAHRHEVYDSLVMAELTDFMAHNPESLDVIVSADTLCYFGELESVFQVVASSLKSDGYFAFTLEASENKEGDICLHPHGRYTHSKKYIKKSIKSTGLSLISLKSVVLRTEAGEPVIGHLVVARKQLKHRGVPYAV